MSKISVPDRVHAFIGASNAAGTGDTISSQVRLVSYSQDLLNELVIGSNNAGYSQDAEVMRRLRVSLNRVIESLEQYQSLVTAVRRFDP